MDNQHSFHFADYIVFAGTIVISIGIGIYYALSGGKQKTTSEFLVGNRQMSVLPVAISLMVSFESSIMMLGIPAEIYMFGIQWFWGNIGFFIANLLSIKIMVPLIHPLPITSAYEYLELRFKSHAVRLLGTVLGILTYAIYMGVVLFGPAIALEAVTGFPLWSSIIVVAIAAVIYTAIGGIKAVIWTDVFQSFIMFAGMFAVLIKGTMSIGSVGKTWEIARDNGRINIFNFDPDPRVRHSFWNLLIGSTIRGMGLAFNQSSVQRIISIPTIKQAKHVMWITTPAFLVTLFLAAVEGVVAYSYYHTVGCDPLASKQIRDPNQVVPYMVMDIFNGVHGMPGLFLASLFSASLSTLSSGLSSLSALLWTDLIKPHIKPISEKKATIIAKTSVIGFGGFAVAIAFLVSTIGGTLTQISATIISAFSGPLTGLFFLGCFVPYANAKGAFTGGLLSLVYCFWFAYGKSSSKGAKRTAPLPPAPTDMCFNSNLTNGMDWLFGNSTDMMASYTKYTTAALPSTPIEVEGLDQMYSLSYLWIGPIGIILVLVIGSVVSLCTGPIKVEDRDPRYLIPLFDELLCCLPESWRKALRCGVDYSGRKDFEDGKEVRTDRISNYTAIIENKDHDDKNGDPSHNHTIIIEGNNDYIDVNGDITDLQDTVELNNDLSKTHDAINEERIETHNAVESNGDINEVKTELENSGDKNIPMVTLNDTCIIHPQNDSQAEGDSDLGGTTTDGENKETDKLMPNKGDN